MLVLLLGATVSLLSWVVNAARGTISPVGQVGSPLLGVLLLACFLVVGRGRRYIPVASAGMYVATSAYLHACLAWVFFFPGGMTATLAGVLQYYPLLYLVSHFVLKRFATFAAVVNYVVLALMFALSNHLGMVDDTLRQHVVFSALLAHPICITASHFILSLRQRADSLEQREIALSRQLLADSLTGASNRQALEGFFTADEWQRTHGTPERLAVMVVDVDHFKRVNDTLGHSAGDIVLKRIAQVLGQSVRPGDIVARWGGEEFVIVTRHTGEAGALAVAQRVHQAVQKIMPGGGLSAVTVSIGVASRTKHNESCQVLFEYADACVLQAKKNGRNQVRLAAQDGTRISGI